MLCCCDSSDHPPTMLSAACATDTAELEAPPDIDASLLAKAELDVVGGVSFELGTAEMTADGKRGAAKYGQILERFPETVVKLVGFSNEDLPTPIHNRQLARDRCRAVRALFEAQGCSNKMAIQGRGRTFSCSHQNQVVVDLCEAEQLETLESTAITEDAAFSQMQREAEERKVVVDVQEPEHVAEEPRLVAEEQQLFLEQVVQVNLGFSDVKGNTMSFQLQKRPLGITFARNQTPLEVKSCVGGSHAQECGVKVGMVLTTIQGESISNANYDKVWEKLTRAVNKLPGA